MKSIEQLEIKLKLRLILKDFEEKYKIHKIKKIQRYNHFTTVSFLSKIDESKTRYFVFDDDITKDFTESLLKEQFTEEELKELSL